MSVSADRRAEGHPSVPNGVTVVAVETSRWARDMRGIGRYVSTLLPRIARLRPELRFILFAANDADAATIRDRCAAHDALRGRVDVRRLRQLPETRADVFWYPWNAIITKPRRAPILVSVMDVAPLAMPDPRWTGILKNFRWRNRYREVAALATRIVTISDFSAREIVRFLGVPRERIDVTLLAADDVTPSDPARDADALARLGVRAPFVLAVGAADRRKNFDLLQRAMAQVHAAYGEVTMVWAGPRKKRSAQLPLAAWERQLGYVSDEDLWTLYRNAALFVSPSRYEGFGLPVLEAMRAGAPVVLANAASLPEVGGTAAAYVPADDQPVLATVIGTLLRDPARRDAMRAASRAHADAYTTWDDTARRTLAALDATRAAFDAPTARPNG